MNKRAKLRSKHEGNQYYCRFRHPVRGKTVCVCLGDADEQATNLRALDRIFQDKSLWLTPPVETPVRIRNAWMGPDSVIKVLGKQPMRGAVKLRVDGADTARLQAELERAHAEIDRLRNEIDRQAAELVHWRGRKAPAATRCSLREARETWWDRWRKGKSDGNCKLVRTILNRFISAHGENRLVEHFVNKEAEILDWIRDQRCSTKSHHNAGDPWGAAARQRAEIYITKFLRESGVDLDSKKIIVTTDDDRRKAAGKIRYLESRADAEKLAKHLSPYWRAAFKIQLALGLRPSELATLHRSNFSSDLSTLTLEPLGSIGLKTGTRSLPVPPITREIIQSILSQRDVLFPQMLQRGRPSKHGSQKLRLRDIPYKRGESFCHSYLKELKSATKAAGLNIRIDCRVPRRTCASWLLQQNVGADRIAKLLGNSPGVILKHYGDPRVQAIDLSAMTLEREEECKRPIKLKRQKKKKAS